MDRGKRLRYLSDEMMDNLHSVLEGIIPHINAVLEACAQMPRVSLQATKL